MKVVCDYGIFTTIPLSQMALFHGSKNFNVETIRRVFDYGLVFQINIFGSGRSHRLLESVLFYRNSILILKL